MSLELLTGLINSLIHEPHAGLLNGIIFGAKATLDPQLQKSLITTGTLHIIALSGMNISILVSLVDTVLLRFLRRPIANLASVFIIIGFIWFVGPTPSVIRAGIMGSVALLSISFGRQNLPILAWILAVSTMLLLNPRWLIDLSFQLSVMATLGIILFGSRPKKDTGPVPFSVPSLLYDDLRVTMAAQVFTVPIILFQFHRISLVSPLTNILIGWLMAPIMVLGFTTALGGLIWWPVGQVIAWFAWVPLQYVITIVDLTAKIPLASVQW